MNDPMEGIYLYNQNGNVINEDIRKRLKKEKKKIGICSLSRNSNNELMWAHYAEGHKGVAIGVEVDQKHEVRPVQYDGLYQVDSYNFHSESAIDILSHKLDVWQYEKEERVFVYNKKYVNVKIKEVICGSRMSKQNKGFITDLIKKIDSKIMVSTRPSSNYI
jgi:hypothetical protein